MALILKLASGTAALFLLSTMAPTPPAGQSADAPTAKNAAKSVRSGTGSFALQGQMIQGGLVSGVVPKGTTALTLDGKPVAFAADGRFIIAFDRDAGASALLEAALADGGVASQPLTIAPREWDISRLSTLPKYPVPQPEFERVRPAELSQIVAARAKTTEAAGWREKFQWPVTGRISTLFGSQRVYANGEAGSFHSGIDIARPTGIPVVAPADGVVILAAAKPFTLEGNLLMLDHGMGLNSAFLHLSRIDVTPGQHVRKGQPIGLVGMSGRATGPHLHWSLKWQDARIDPLLVVGPMPKGE